VTSTMTEQSTLVICWSSSNFMEWIARNKFKQFYRIRVWQDRFLGRGLHFDAVPSFCLIAIVRNHSGLLP
jgi:hypothetical protein